MSLTPGTGTWFGNRINDSPTNEVFDLPSVLTIKSVVPFRLDLVELAVTTFFKRNILFLHVTGTTNSLE